MAYFDRLHMWIWFYNSTCLVFLCFYPHVPSEGVDAIGFDKYLDFIWSIWCLAIVLYYNLFIYCLFIYFDYNFVADVNQKNRLSVSKADLFKIINPSIRVKSKGLISYCAF